MRRRTAAGLPAASPVLAVLLASLALAAPLARALTPDEVAVIANVRDPLSVQLAEEYVAARGIPPGNLLEVALPPAQDGVSQERFAVVYAQVLAQTPAHVQAYVLTWVQPFRVRCMSISTAFAAGFDEAWCGGRCELTRASPYYDSASPRPWDDFRLRPTMLLAARDLAAGRALMERGLAADGTHPRGTGYLVQTGDPHRNVRAADFPGLVRAWEGRLTLRHVRAEAVRDADDVLFYFTGTRAVPDLDSNRYLPGAVADHLTSSGGRLVGGRQMSLLRWLEAGVTASYGTVVEPCAFAQKFPRPRVLLEHYVARGETVLEAYWKSVAMPGQGVFAGEPLARPFAPRDGAAGSGATMRAPRRAVDQRRDAPGRYAEHP